jgi:hypothetical protein
VQNVGIKKQEVPPKMNLLVSAPITMKKSTLEKILVKSRPQLPIASSKSRFLALQKIGKEEETGVKFFESKSGRSWEEIENIDAKDKDSSRVTEYINDIYSYMMLLETSGEFLIQPNFLAKHADLTPNMRAILVDWINEVHTELNLVTEAYHLAISILDRYTQASNDIQRRSYQLVGTAALFIASKVCGTFAVIEKTVTNNFILQYEETYPRKVREFAFMTDDAYTNEQITAMEIKILSVLDFRLNSPLPTHFIRRFFKAAKIQKTEYLACKYLLELATIDYDLATTKPSEVNFLYNLQFLILIVSL